MPNLLKRIMNFEICKKEINYKKLNPRNWKAPSFKKRLRFLIFLAIFLAACIIIKDEVEYQFGLGYWDDGGAYYDDYESDEESIDSACNVMGIEVHGDLVTYISPEDIDSDGNQLYDEVSSDDIVYALMDAESDPEVKAVLLEIDSYGGSPVASYEINQALHREVSKPVVVMVRNAATSGGYLVAVAADKIFVSPYSDVGGIGITMSYLDYTDQNKEEGLNYNSLSVGKYKDYGDPDKSLTEEEKSLIMRDLNIIYDDFVKTVATDRNLDVNKVKELADGSSMPGQLAIDNGLVDEIGGITEVKEYLKSIIGEEIDICW